MNRTIAAARRTRRDVVRFPTRARRTVSFFRVLRIRRRGARFFFFGRIASVSPLRYIYGDAVAPPPPPFPCVFPPSYLASPSTPIRSLTISNTQ